MDDASLFIGFDLGGTKMHAAVVDAAGHALCSRREKTRAHEGPNAVIARMAELCAALRQELGARAADLRGICVGVPGGVDEATGVVDAAPNLGWSGVPLGPRLGQALGLPVVLDNDVRVAVLGEHAYGMGQKTQTMIGLFVGTGIGGGLVVDGQLHTGQRGVAGEMGHMTLVPHGPRCRCGRRGCVEALASKTAMAARLRHLARRGWRVPRGAEEAGAPLTSSTIAQALEEKNRAMQQVMKEAQYYLGLLAGNLANLLDPEVIVVGGGLAERLGERFVAPIRAHAYKHFLVQRDREAVRIVATELKELAAPLGAALLGRRRLAVRDGVDSTPAARHGTPSWPAPSA